MQNSNYLQCHDESENEYLVRLGRLKESKTVNINWDQLAVILNENFSPDCIRSESYWRKKYRRLIQEEDFAISENTDFDRGIVKLLNDIEKQRMRISDERTSYNKMIRSQARSDTIIDIFQREINRYSSQPPELCKTHASSNGGSKAILAMVSDVHYGLAFDSFGGRYDSSIARDRIMYYANQIVEKGKECNDCYVALMGDLVSGIIHQTIRLENKENIIQQIIGVSELISDFLWVLAANFENVYVNSVDGNHSRLDPNLENVLRSEKLDSLVPWYCKTKLQNIKNVIFVDTNIDTSVGFFSIYGKNVISVHGDLEKDLKTSTLNIEKRLGQHIDVVLAAHLHVAEFMHEDTVYVRNGCVCGSGDDYTTKKRLFSPPCQVCMICSPDSPYLVESVCPVVLP